VHNTESFGRFSFPKLVWDQTNEGPLDKVPKSVDEITVIGASGNVGKLVALRLSDEFKVNGVVRDSMSATRVLPFFNDLINQKKVNLLECNLVEEAMRSQANGIANAAQYPVQIQAALKSANTLIICTGTTAFPTQAWSKSSSGMSSFAPDVLKALVRNKFSVAKTMLDLDKQGLNTPENIDNICNRFIVNAWDNLCQVQQKRIVMISSIGVNRRKSMPFAFLNLCGVLEAKARGEEAVKSAARKGGYSYTIVRPGQLFGGPYDNNYYLGTLFKLDKDVDEQKLQLRLGDELLGDTLRSSLAEVTAQICELDAAKNVEFSVINVKGDLQDISSIQASLKDLRVL